MASTTSTTLKLLIEKGPRKGGTLEFNPRSTVRIGRVVRGNNVAIKDPGISSKHLSIEFNYDSGKWVITDLESSNGTILNTSQIKPLFPSELKNGDEIKIGELTSIRVEIILIGEEISIRRNPRRQTAPKSGGLDLGVRSEVGVEGGTTLGEGGSIRVRDLKTEDVEKGVDNAGRENRRGRGRGRPKKVSILEDVNAENDVGLVGIDENFENAKTNMGRGTGTRRTRSSKREGDELLVLLPEVGLARRTRGAKNVDNVIGSSMQEKISESEALYGDTCKEEVNVGLVEDKKRAGRGRKKKVDVECSETAKYVVLEDSNNKEVLKVDVPSVREEPCEEPVDDSLQQDMVEETTREVTELEVSEQAGGEVVAEEKPYEESVDETQQNMLEETTNREVIEQARDILVGGDNPCEEPRSEAGNESIIMGRFEQDTCNNFENDVVLQEEESEESEMGEVSKELDMDKDCREKDQDADNVPDLEKMTLGQWFDYLEVYLPKQIHDVKDEIIADMRKRAKQFADFMLQQQNNKGKLPVGT